MTSLFLGFVLIASNASTNEFGHIRGLVFDKTSRPLSNVLVRVKNKSTASDFDGAFLLKLSRGTHWLEIQSPDGRTAGKNIVVQPNLSLIHI